MKQPADSAEAFGRRVTAASGIDKETRRDVRDLKVIFVEGIRLDRLFVPQTLRLPLLRSMTSSCYTLISRTIGAAVCSEIRSDQRKRRKVHFQGGYRPPGQLGVTSDIHWANVFPRMVHLENLIHVPDPVFDNESKPKWVFEKNVAAVNQLVEGTGASLLRSTGYGNEQLVGRHAENPFRSWDGKKR